MVEMGNGGGMVAPKLHTRAEHGCGIVGRDHAFIVGILDEQ